MAGEFKTHRLNEAGIKKCDAIGEVFENTLEVLRAMCANEYKGTGAREMALVATKLQEACFFAKRAVAILPEYQVGYVPIVEHTYRVDQDETSCSSCDDHRARSCSQNRVGRVG